MKKISVVCAVIIKDDKVFCCRRGGGRVLEGYWEFPGGKIEKGETDSQALIREIREELNSDIAVERYIASAQYDYTDMAPYEDFHIDLTAELCSVTGGNLELSEHTQCRWLGGDELDSVLWAPADKPIVEAVKKMLEKDKFKIVKTYNDGTEKNLWSGECSDAELFRTFNKILSEQHKEYFEAERKIPFQIKAFNKKGEQILQETFH